MPVRTLLLVVSLVVASLAVDGGVAVALADLGPGGTFVDDDGHPAESYIEAAFAAGYLDGCDSAHPDRFCPSSRASWTDVDRGIVRAMGTGRSRLSCGSSFCSAVSIPVSAVAAALAVPLPGLVSMRRGEAPIDRATLAVMLSSAAHLELPEIQARRSFSIAATGDILPHTPLMSQAARNDGDGGFDFDPMFADIKPIISAVDLGLCHLETPLSSDNAALSSYPVFYSPREVAEAVVVAGYDGCSTASNHSFDKRTTGVLSTLGVIDEAGLGRAGTTDLADGPSWWMYDVEGVTVAHLSYTYGLNGFRLPADQPWLVNLIDEEQIIADAAEVRELGAEFIAVSLHWGNEYQPLPSSYQRGIAEALLASPDVDVIIGHHAHVVQAVEKINGKFVLYGLGNLVSNQFFSLPTQDGVIAVLDVVEGVDGFSVAEIEFVPTKVERGSYRIVPISIELGTELGQQDRIALEQSWQRTLEALSALDESIAGMVAPIP
ncbi:MAG: CapA family protein [Acidimicrobiia bacterium]|nr:CapA family protein [Acidimicrobiia bacterium]